MRERRIRQRDDTRAGHKLFQKSASRSSGDEDMQKENHSGHRQVSVQQLQTCTWGGGAG